MVLGFIGGHRIDTYRSCEELTGDTIDSVDKGKSLEKYVTRTLKHSSLVGKKQSAAAYF